MADARVYDITRLVTRLLNRTPNGIDRVDFAFARHMLDQGSPNRFGAIASFTGPRLFAQDASLAAVEGIGQHWGEADDPEKDSGYIQVRARLAGETPPPLAGSKSQVSRRRSGQAQGVFAWVREYGWPIGQSLAAHVPQGAAYLNVSQFPLWISSYFNWLKKRPDVKAVFFIHDLLPIESPEYFRPAEYERHCRRLRNLAEFGSAAIVSSESVRVALTDHLKKLGRANMPILAIPLPVSPIFHAATSCDPKLSNEPYFVFCSTIEPRKNHLMLLHVWRELVKAEGEKAPKLVLIGNRGWENENVVDLLERCEAIRSHVIEVAGLSTPALRQLLSGARAALMPSFAEGYGLPLAEALAARVPVIASDIPVFREIGGDQITALSPIAGDVWLEKIRAFTPQDSADRKAAFARIQSPALSWDDYFVKIDQFVADL
jgi:glycosyltransferase involved in cell wall biosynthesis